MLTEKEYFDYYAKNGRCIDQINKPKNPLNKRQLYSKYSKYIKKENIKKAKTEQKVSKGSSKDKKWIDIKLRVFFRDDSECQLLKKINDNEKSIIENHGYYSTVIDPAHVFNKSSFPSLYYEPLNVVCLNRISHSFLDNNKNPITGEAISKEEIKVWWIFIIGEDRYKLLESMI